MTAGRTSSRSRAVRGLRYAILALVAGLGAVLFFDRPGLRTEHFALTTPWEGRPVHTSITEPRLDTAGDAALVTDAVFSLRWRGWLHVREPGRHRFSADADDGAYLRLDDELIVDTNGTFGERRTAGRIELEPGYHPIEIGLYQTTGESRLAIGWKPPGRDAAVRDGLPVEDLHTRPAPGLQAAGRRLTRGWDPVYRRLLGAILLLTGTWMLLRASPIRPKRLPTFERPGERTGLLAGLVVLAFLGVFSATGTLRGGDDTAYLAAATFNEKHWFFNRYVHVYLLKLFTLFGGGDPLLGVRLWWSAMFAATVGALAVAVRSIGPRLQPGTLVVTLFVLLSQTTILGLAGAGFADFSCMLFVTAAVAVYLHGFVRPERETRTAGRHHWHALALGALSLAAFRSKEVGAIAFLLVALLAIEDGRLNLRALPRRLVYWTAGAAAVLLGLVVLDGWILGDFFFTFDPERMARSKVMNFPGGVAPRAADANWLDAIWRAPGHAAGLSLRYLWLGVLAAAVAGGLRRRRLEIRLLHLLPIAYLLALIALYVRMPHPISIRMLIPILPLGCLMVGLLLRDAGLDEIAWRRLLVPRQLIPAALVAVVFCLIVIPYRMGRLPAGGFLPEATLVRFGWDPDVFVKGVLLPAAILAAAALLAFALRDRPARLVALATVCMVLFGLGFDYNRVVLRQRTAAQESDLLLYPWRTFRAELTADPPGTIVFAPALAWRYRMGAQTRTSIARLALGRDDVYVTLERTITPETEAAIGSVDNYREWRRAVPGLERTATIASDGLLVLVRPRSASTTPAEPSAP